MTGSVSGTTLSDASGNYSFSALPSGGSYIVTPTKTALPPATNTINTIDIVAIQRHFLNVTFIPPGCRLTAADVNGDNAVNTIDAVAVQRFFLGVSTGIANTGKYLFSPVNRSYSGIVTNQTGQNYDALVLGDVSSPFAGRPEGPEPAAAGQEEESVESYDLPLTLSLPNLAVDLSAANFVVPVKSTVIDESASVVGFQGDLIFDERIVTFQSEPVQKAGLTSGNWNVSGNILSGKGPMRILRISAFSSDLVPLSGSGTLFELRMKRVNQADHGTELLWAAPPDDFLFIDSSLRNLRPTDAAPGSVVPSSAH